MVLLFVFIAIKQQILPFQKGNKHIPQADELPSAAHASSQNFTRSIAVSTFILVSKQQGEAGEKRESVVVPRPSVYMQIYASLKLGNLMHVGYNAVGGASRCGRL